MHFAGHYLHVKQKFGSDLLLWIPTYDTRWVGHPATTNVEKATIYFIQTVTLGYTLRSSLDKHHHLYFTLSLRLSSRYPAKMLTDIDNTDDPAITVDTITNATVLLHHLKNTANDVGLYVNTSKTEFIGFNQQGSIQTVSGE